MTGLFVASVILLFVAVVVVLDRGKNGDAYPGTSDTALQNMRDALLLDLHTIERSQHNPRDAIDLAQRIFMLNHALERRQRTARVRNANATR